MAREAESNSVWLQWIYTGSITSSGNGKQADSDVANITINVVWYHIQFLFNLGMACIAHLSKSVELA